MSSFKHDHHRQDCVPNYVTLMRWISSHSAGQHPNESDSHKTDGFSARKSCIIKRLAISDEPDDRRQHSVVCWTSDTMVEIPRPMKHLPSFLYRTRRIMASQVWQ